MAQDFPWPTSIGSHLRLAQVITALAEEGEVDLFALVPARRLEPCVVPPPVRLARVTTVVRPRPDTSLRRRLRWVATRGLPLEIVAQRSAVLPGALASWARPGYDLAWVSKAATFELLDRPALGPTIVDLDDLEDRKIRGRLAVLDAERRPAGIEATAHCLAAEAQATLNARRWAALQRSVSAAVDRVVLCSDDDVARAGLRGAVVVPNGYDDPAHPAGRAGVGVPPTVLLPGSFRYGPNADAARWLTSDIAPRLRALVPEAVIRLVGETDDTTVALEHPPEVTVVGRVPAMEPELGRADLVAVPVRYGSGTRVKILEAFAHRIPVVSTTLGAEGLGAEPGRHLLVADDADSFARACAALLHPADEQQADRRRAMVEAAHALFLARFQWSSVRARIRALARETAAAVAR